MNLTESEREDLRQYLYGLAHKEVDEIREKVELVHMLFLAKLLTFFRDEKECPGGCRGFAAIVQAICEERAARLYVDFVAIQNLTSHD